MQFVNFFLSFQVKMIISIHQVYQNLTSTHIHPLVPDISLQFFYQHFGFMRTLFVNRYNNIQEDEHFL